MKLMNIDTDNMCIPETSYSCMIRMSSIEFNRICRDICVLSDTVIISCSSEFVSFSSKGEIGNGTIRIQAGPLVTIESSDNMLTQKYSLRYLNLFAKGNLSTTVILSLNKDVPLSIIRDFYDD